jgi:hypothetical protein
MLRQTQAHVRWSISNTPSAANTGTRDKKNRGSMVRKETYFIKPTYFSGAKRNAKPFIPTMHPQTLIVNAAFDMLS